MRADGRTDRRTDVKKLIVAFCSFANAPQAGQNYGRLIKTLSNFHEVSVPVAHRTDIRLAVASVRGKETHSHCQC